MFNVLAYTKLADPAATGQLTSGVLWDACQGEQSDFLVASFQLVVVANDVAKSGERITKGFYRFDASNVQNVEQVQRQPEGLLIEVQKPYTIQPGRGLGIETEFSLRGDFDVTAAYDNFHTDAPFRVPGQGNGVGFGICVQLVKGQLVWISRMVRVTGEGVFWSKVGTRQEGFLTTTEKSGRFRVVRTGPTLTCLWAPGTQGDNYQVLERPEIGFNDVSSIWLHLFTAGQTLDVGARLLELKIHGQKESNPVVRDEALPPPSRKGLLAVAVLLGVGILLLALVFHLLRRRRSQTSSITSP